MWWKRLNPMIRRDAARVSPGVACLVMVAASGVSAQEYTLVDLETLGGTSSRANGISEGGTIVGYARTASGVKHAVLWNESGIVDLGAPEEFIVSDGLAVNDSIQVAGRGEGNPQSYQGYSWESGSWTPIGVLPGHGESMALDIDSGGRIVGTSFILGHEHRAVMWDAGVLTDLGTLGDSSTAFGLNEVGQVVGYSVANLPGGEQGLRAFLWEDGEMTALDPLPGDVATEAYDVNDAGDVVGSSWWYTTQFFSAKQATLWRDGGAEVIDLGYVPAPPWSCGAEHRWHKSIARATNNRGQVVGEAMCVASGAPKAAFLWQDGVMHNLNDLIPGGSGWNFRSALDINDAGQIVGYGLAPNGELRGFLLEPAPLTSETICPDDPHDFLRSFGGPITGDALDLCASDDVRMVVLQAAAVSPLLPFIRLEFWAHSTLVDSPVTSVGYTIEGHVSALVSGGQNPNTLRTWIRNYNPGSWELIDERSTASSTDEIITHTQTTNAPDYVNAGDGEVRVKQDVFDPGNVFTPNWFLKLDLYEVAVSK